MQSSATFDSKYEQSLDSDRQKLTYSSNRVTKREQFASFKLYFDGVCSAYVSIRQYPALACVEVDPDATSQNRTWTPYFADFLCDVELTTELALSDDLDLQAAWFKLAAAAGAHVPPAIAQQVIARCGRAYKSKQLDPGVYLRPSNARNRSHAKTGRAI
jgi:TfoX/Sxy family transcriptional regulator of competence genes